MPTTKRKRTAPSRQTEESDHPSDHLQMFTIGHATRPVSELIALLQEHNVKTLVDIRTIPRSRTNPQHNKNKLEKVLPRRRGSSTTGLEKSWEGFVSVTNLWESWMPGGIIQAFEGMQIICSPMSLLQGCGSCAGWQRTVTVAVPLCVLRLITGDAIEV